MNIVDEIQKLKKEKNAVILAHNYQLPEIQDIADYNGDSLGLSVEASKTKADIIIFCGVYFMAETAKILSPQKTVLIPDKEAGCPMADMITGEELRALKKKHPNAKVICYVNSSAEVKAESDVCCTSANSIKVVEKFFKEDDEIIFVPDKYLALYTASQIKRKFIFWHGYCPSHAKILSEYILEKKKLYPNAEVLVHPECRPEITELADKVLSTGGMSKYVANAKARDFIIGTEEGMIYRLAKDNPGKNFYLASELAHCINMKRITLDKVLACLRTNRHEIFIGQDIIEKAGLSIRRMVEC
ncbi:quinolinate synthetase complex, A subunit [Candidatus Omnitrophus magneticus]|uniref:Quinolinate synthase n=1 Tax=Candidatus Omnitrophus magneticus TaxID=1609969 RepID=A0A0F0CWV1_9BACT|nr:quinolinate synthetase complex, A subunit [Candidatus Omnitrophus magneticus]